MKLKILRTKRILIYTYIKFKGNQKKIINYIKKDKIAYIKICNLISNIDLNDFICILENDFLIECKKQNLDSKCYVIIKRKKDKLKKEDLEEIIK